MESMALRKQPQLCAGNGRNMAAVLEGLVGLLWRCARLRAAHRSPMCRSRRTLRSAELMCDCVRYDQFLLIQAYRASHARAASPHSIPSSRAPWAGCAAWPPFIGAAPLLPLFPSPTLHLHGFHAHVCFCCTASLLMCASAAWPLLTGASSSPPAPCHSCTAWPPSTGAAAPTCLMY